MVTNAQNSVGCQEMSMAQPNCTYQCRCAFHLVLRLTLSVTYENRVRQWYNCLGGIILVTSK